MNDHVRETGSSYLDNKAGSPRVEARAAADPVVKTAKTIAVKTGQPSPAPSGNKPDPVVTTAKTRIATKLETSAPTQHDEKTDPVIDKAKVTITAKMEDPTSVEFVEMKRAFRKNTLGNSVDTICGYVRGKTVSGESIGERAFLYLVKEDEAYVVDDSRDKTAAIAYSNICN